MKPLAPNCPQHLLAAAIIGTYAKNLQEDGITIQIMQRLSRGMSEIMAKTELAPDRYLRPKREH